MLILIQNDYIVFFTNEVAGIARAEMTVRLSVCPSVRPYVSHTRVLYQNEQNVMISSPPESRKTDIRLNWHIGWAVPSYVVAVVVITNYTCTVAGLYNAMYSYHAVWCLMQVSLSGLATDEVDAFRLEVARRMRTETWFRNSVPWSPEIANKVSTVSSFIVKHC